MSDLIITGRYSTLSEIENINQDYQSDGLVLRYFIQLNPNVDKESIKAKWEISVQTNNNIDLSNVKTALQLFKLFNNQN